MKFTALPVTVGDSFLFQMDGITVLVDGGQNKNHIVKLLLSKLPDKHIDILICTHYDADHYNGVMGIIKSNQFTIKEVWLPEIIGNIGYTLKKDIHLALEAFRHLPEFQRNDNINLLADEYSRGNENIESEEDFEDTMLRPIDLPYTELYELGLQMRNMSMDNQKMFQNFYNIPRLITAFYSSGSFIRWFKYRNGDALSRIINNIIELYGVNCDEVALTRSTTANSLLKLLYLTTINRYSLNFIFERDDYPHILFTADSDISYRSTAFCLKKNSIVTTPHHGATSADPAYGKITGEDLIFVRSDRSQLVRPSTTYVRLPYRKYCTICRNRTIKNEVTLIYDATTGNFNTVSNLCIC
jgi:hypothetical protein